ncbi:MAG TPA: hypothetical protein IAB44_10190 [Candidatus Limivivens intestinipullorum]|uniref:Uncharacterized protein n=1 Tax=Candidatus Limivivens intestinipullorum TaxID=2840858 RepID=A0A9D1ETY8_9FIRM|nr:hypothetical protein [Candidatus Limivivens intestinipullorum]
MRKRCIFFFLILTLVFSASGCAPESSEEGLDAKLVIESMPVRDGAFFPDSFTGGTETVRFDCELEVSENFDAENFFLPAIPGLRPVDEEAVYEAYVEGRDVGETHEFSPTDYDPKGSTVYVFKTDGETTGEVSISSGFAYFDSFNNAFHGGDIYPESAKGASQENEVAFGSGEECVAQVKETLAGFSFPVEEYEFSWFSLDASDLDALTQEALLGASQEAGEFFADAWDLPEEGWTEADNRYMIYAWQYYSGIPVFLPWMSMDRASAKESYLSAPVSSTFTGLGMIDLAVEAPYAFESTGQKADFLPFPEIASALVRKYTYLLDLSGTETEEKETEEPVTYTVSRAMLALRVYLDEEKTYAAEPVWYFEVQNSSTGYLDVLYFNALTGQEIYLA